MPADVQSLPPGIPPQIAGYRLVRLVGSGGMGMVYEALDVAVDRRVALKIMRLDRGLAERFEREARALAKVRDPGIVEVFEFGEDKGYLFIAMEYLEGHDLGRVLEKTAGREARAKADVDDRRGKLPVAPYEPGASTVPDGGRGPAVMVEAGASETEGPVAEEVPATKRGPRQTETVVAWIRAAALALERAHKAGIIHRDIKPSNLFLSRDGTLKILDFGLARDTASVTITRTGDLFGTPQYMSPEQILTKRIGIDHRTDIYSLGVVLYQLLAGHYPFPHASSRELYSKIILEDPAPLATVAPWVSRDLEAVVFKAMAKNPRLRYQTAAALAEDLEAALKGEPLKHARVPSVVARAAKVVRRGLRRHRVAALIAAALVVVTAVPLIAYRLVQERTAAEFREAVARGDLALLAGDVEGARKHYAEAAIADPDFDAGFLASLSGRDVSGKELEPPARDASARIGAALERGFCQRPPLVAPAEAASESPAGPRTIVVSRAGDFVLERRGAKEALWDARTGELLSRDTATDAVKEARAYFETAGPQRAVVEGGRRAEGTAEGAVLVYDDEVNEPWLRLERSPGRAKHVALSADGRVLATAGDEGSILVVELLPRPQEGVPFEPRGFAVAQDGSFLIGAREGRQLALYRRDGERWSFERAVDSGGAVSCCRAVAAEKTAVWGTAGGGLFALDAVSGAVRRLEPHREAVLSLAYAEGTRCLYSGDAAGQIRCLDLAGGGERWARSVEGDRVWALAVSPDGRVLYAAGRLGKVSALSAETGAEAPAKALAGLEALPAAFLHVGSTGAVMAVALDGTVQTVSPDGKASRPVRLEPVVRGACALPGWDGAAILDGQGGLTVVTGASGKVVLTLPKAGATSVGAYGARETISIVLGSSEANVRSVSFPRAALDALARGERPGAKDGGSFFPPPLPGLPSPAGCTFLDWNVQALPEYLHDQTGIVLVLVPGGTFRMGSPDSEPGRDSDEGPVHAVAVKPFLIGKHEVTQAQWERVMGKNPSYFKGPDRPVVGVSWEDCQEFCRRTGLSLPSEAEWEYACRAGTATAIYTGPLEILGVNNAPALDKIAWYAGNSGGTHAVGEKEPNAFGLHDMIGNVWEWCEDWFHPSYEGAPADGSAWLAGGEQKYRVLRGGSWFNFARLCRSADRNGFLPGVRNPNIGLRVRRTME